MIHALVMSRTYNKHKKNYYGMVTEFKKDSVKNKRAHQKRLIENLKKATDEEIEEVAEHYEGGSYKEVVGADWWCYD